MAGPSRLKTGFSQLSASADTRILSVAQINRLQAFKIFLFAPKAC